MTPMEHERCEQCGFDGSTYDDGALLAAIDGLGPRWRDALTRAGAELRRRPAPEVWSAIEYGAHTRDITALHVFGVEQALTGSEPVFGDIDADALIDSAAASYEAADPDAVANEIAEQATKLAAAARASGPGAWARGLTIGTDRREVRWLLEHALHDSLHHLDDVDRGVARLRAAGA
jgi:DinB superfamily